MRAENRAYISAFLLVALSAALLSPQPSLSQQAEGPKVYAKVKKKGWKLSGLEGAELQSHEELKKVGVGSATLYLSVLKPKGGGAIVLDAPTPILSEVIRRYDVDGRAFCYYYSGVCLGLHKENGKRYYVPLGCTTAYAFYDEDGDGKFERLERFLPAHFELRIPEHLLKKGAT